jgi:asparagine synthase (glutamine-hydrolysing)
MISRTNIDCSVFEYRLLDILNRYVERNRCECIALSGGIDTTLIAAIATLNGIELNGFYAYYVSGIPRDMPYVIYVSKKLNIPAEFISMDLEYIKSALNDVYRCISKNVYHELCVELRNDVVFYTVLKVAKEHGCSCIYTGSGGDEVFAGYGFMLWLPEEELEGYREKWGVGGRYPEIEMGKCLGVNVVAPYLSKEVLEEAMKIPARCLRGSGFEGKRILRNILSRFGMEFIGERAKTPAEAGAGTDSICITP